MSNQHKSLNMSNNTTDVVLFKDRIKIYIDQFSRYSFDRMCSCNPECGFNQDNFDQFKDHNKKCVDDLNDQDVYFVSKLIFKVLNSDILQCDEENFGEWVSTAVYFNINRKIVITHPR